MNSPRHVPLRSWWELSLFAVRGGLRVALSCRSLDLNRGNNTVSFAKLDGEVRCFVTLIYYDSLFLALVDVDINEKDWEIDELSSSLIFCSLFCWLFWLNWVSWNMGKRWLEIKVILKLHLEINLIVSFWDLVPLELINYLKLYMAILIFNSTQHFKRTCWLQLGLFSGLEFGALP